MNTATYGKLVNDSPKAEPARKLYPVARPHSLFAADREQLEDYYEYLYIKTNNEPAPPMWWNTSRDNLIGKIEELEAEIDEAEALDDPRNFHSDEFYNVWG